MQREDPQASASGAQASGQGNSTLQEALQDFQISEISETQLDAFINSLTGPGISKAHFRKFLLYVLKFVKYNQAKYERLKIELGYLKEEAASIKDELMTLIVFERIPPLPSAPQAAAPTPPSAHQAAAPIPPLAPQATVPIPPLAPQATAPTSAFQAVVPPPAPQAMTIGPVVSSTTYIPPVLNANRTISRKMDQVRQQCHSYLFW